MAKLVYDDTGRLLFTKEMKEEYTILMPQMLPVHFPYIWDGVYVRLLLQDKITLMACRYVALIQVAIAQGFHLFPFRTEKLSLVTPMVLRHSGRVGSCRF